MDIFRVKGGLLWKYLRSQFSLNRVFYSFVKWNFSSNFLLTDAGKCLMLADLLCYAWLDPSHLQFNRYHYILVRWWTMRDSSFQVKLKAMIDVTIYALKQFSMLTRCCPHRSELCLFSFVPYDYLPQAARSHTEDDITKDLFEFIEVKYHLLAFLLSEELLFN